MRNALSKKIFRIGGRDREPKGFCETCRTEGNWQYLTGQRKTGSTRAFPIRDIQARQGCPFCKLLYGLLVLTCLQSRGSRLDDAICTVETLPGSGTGLNVRVREYSGMRICLQKLPGNVRLPGVSNVARDPQVMDLARLRQTLETCLRDHKRCQFKPISGSNKKRILLINLQQHCLVEKPYDCGRVALSYVWGKDQDQALKTTLGRLAELKQEGSLLQRQSEIPKTIWDAMLLTRELGQRYLWVSHATQFPISLASYSAFGNIALKHRVIVTPTYKILFFVSG